VLKLTTAPRVGASGSTGENWTKSSNVQFRSNVRRRNDVQWMRFLLATMGIRKESTISTMMKDMDNTHSTGKKAFLATCSINIVSMGVQ
jgi:hypothetical protein